MIRKSKNNEDKPDFKEMWSEVNKNIQEQDAEQDIISRVPELKELSGNIDKATNNCVNATLQCESVIRQYQRAEEKLDNAVDTISGKVDTINGHIDQVMEDAPKKLKVSVNVSDADWQKMQELNGQWMEQERQMLADHNQQQETIWQKHSSRLSEIVKNNEGVWISTRVFYIVGSLSLLSIITIVMEIAFYVCSSLSNITIPTNVTSIAETAFTGCSRLKKIILNSEIIVAKNYNIKSNLKKIFGEQVENYILGENIKSIGDNVFNGCSNLTSMTISENVTRIGSNVFENCINLSNIILPQSVKSIGFSLFKGCVSLSSFSFPENITSIEDSTFFGCKSLSSISIPNNITSIGASSFENCYSLATIIAPQRVTSIGDKAFFNCESLISFLLPDSIMIIGNDVFCGCKSLASITIPKNIIKIEESAFSGCSNLTSVTINSNAIISTGNLEILFGKQVEKYILGESVTKIQDDAFLNCTNLQSIYIPNDLTDFGWDAFPSSIRLYTKRGSKSLLALWKAGYISPYETGTNNILLPTEIYAIETTQMTITIGIKNYYDDYSYTLNNNPIRQEKVTIRDYPEHSGELALKVTKDDMEYTTGTFFTTQKISPTVTRITGTASSITALASYIEGDANVTSERLIFNGKEVNGSTFFRNGLRPNCNYIAEYTITVDNQYSYTKKVNMRTEALNFVNAAPKVISEGNVIIASSSNLDEAETDVGFEWRRTDWTNDFQSNIAGAYLFEGTQEGYIRNMNTNYLWKFRPYYRSADGAYFYGSWLGIDPTNTSYFEPTVHTYSTITVKGNTAQIKGYVMRGSDDIAQQGFMYWKGSTRAGANDVPETETMIEAKGTVMNANLRELDYETTYHYVAFVKTAEGETYYGEEKSFTTEMDTGIGLIEDPESDVKEEGVYDLSGRRINNMQEGIYIIRYTDGSSRKVFKN